MTFRRFRAPEILRTILLSSLLAISLPAHAATSLVTSIGEAATCGNGVVEGNEECDPGTPLGSPDCSPSCRQIEFEPPGLPFDLAASSPVGDANTAQPRIFSSHLHCKPAAVRNGDRQLAPEHVRYRIHLCRSGRGVDAFTPQQVRAVMADATTEFARGGIVLEEESLVKFSDADCIVPLGDPAWSDAIVANTPAGVLPIAFVSGISNPASLYGVGGFCSFFGPFCVNAGAYDSLVIHELGHFFGLAHTFECASGIETAGNCADAGDMICDTPPDRGPVGVSHIAQCLGNTILNGSCSGTCGHKVCTDGSTPDGYNWMSYFDCMPGHFSNEQRDFMRCTLDHELLDYNADAGTSTTTTTTLAPPQCGDENDDGKISVADALGVLRAGIGSLFCPTWRCDYDGSGFVSVIDALEVLRAAVGTPGTAKCPAAP